jgi:site-specific DNA recombinase
MTRAVGYVRVSTDEQVKDGLNLDEDRQRIREKCEAEGWELVNIFDDGGLQGDDPNRPELLALLAALDDIDVVVVRTQDRLSRDTVLWSLVTRAFLASETRLVSFITGAVDLETPQGELVGNMFAAIGRFEKRLTGQRVKQALDARARAGKQTTGRPPFGYRWTEDKTLEEDPAEARVVRRVFDSYVAGRSQRDIVLDLTATGAPTRKGGRWQQSLISTTLSSVTYHGKLKRYNGEIIDGQHPAIVDDETWTKVERMRERHRHTGGHRPTMHLLTNGLGRCGLCGSALLPRRGNQAPRYVCKTRFDLGADHCAMPPIRMDAVDEPLREALADGYFDVEATLNSWQQARAGELTLAQEALDHTQRELAGIDRRLAKVQRGWQDEVIDDADYRSQRAELGDECEGATAAVQQAEARVHQLEQDVAESDVQPVLDALEALKTADLGESRRILRTMFHSFVLVPVNANGTPVNWTHVPTGPGDGAGVLGGRFYLMPRLHQEFVNDDLDVIRQPLPGAPQLNTSPRRRQWA